jgi:hypothetical protein
VVGFEVANISAFILHLAASMETMIQVPDVTRIKIMPDIESNFP